MRDGSGGGFCVMMVLGMRDSRYFWFDVMIDMDVLWRERRDCIYYILVMISFLHHGSYPASAHVTSPPFSSSMYAHTISFPTPGA